ncbi:MAG: hypothetical protein AB1540_09780 [Bdellovibrionota bacterium]
MLNRQFLPLRVPGLKLCALAVMAALFGPLSANAATYSFKQVLVKSVRTTTSNNASYVEVELEGPGTDKLKRPPMIVLNDPRALAPNPYARENHQKLLSAYTKETPVDVTVHEGEIVEVEAQSKK